MKVVLIDNSIITAHGLLHMMLNLTTGISLVEYLKSFERAVHICETREVDAIFFNSATLDEQGIPFLRRTSSRWPELRIYAMIPILDRVSVDYLRRSRSICGVFSIFTGLKGFHQMLTTPPVRGDINYTPEVGDIMLSRHGEGMIDEGDAILDRLSKREYDVLMLSMNGDKNKDIAAKLNISSKTVCTHRCHIREKLCARTMQEVYQIVLEIRKKSALSQNGLGGLVEHGLPAERQTVHGELVTQMI